MSMSNEELQQEINRLNAELVFVLKEQSLMLRDYVEKFAHLSLQLMHPPEYPRMEDIIPEQEKEEGDPALTGGRLDNVG